jgi:hypothetical protein
MLLVARRGLGWLFSLSNGTWSVLGVGSWEFLSDHPGRISNMIWGVSRSSGIGIPVGSFVSPTWLSHMVGWGGLQNSGATLARGYSTGVAGSSGCDTGVVEPGFITQDLIV